MKKILFFIFLFFSSTCVYGAGKVTILVDDTRIKFRNEAPVILTENGNTMVPLYDMVSALGLDLYEVPENNLYYICRHDNTSIAAIMVNTDVAGFTPHSYSIMEPLELPETVFIKDGEVYVPIRFFINAFYYKTEWDDDTFILNIIT